eukprot:scaffold7180_cov50-Cyclotella_meneghiniana.AAC.3
MAPPTLVPLPPGLQKSGFRSDIVHPFRDGNQINICGVLHIQDSEKTLTTQHLWLEDCRLWSLAIDKFKSEGYDQFHFTEYSSAARWNELQGSAGATLHGAIGASDFDPAAVNEATNITANTDSTADDRAYREQLERDNAEKQRELIRLRQQLDSERRQNANNQAAAPAGAPAATPTADFMAFMQQNQAFMQQQQQALLDVVAQLRQTNQNTPATAPAPAASPLTKPSVDFPSWDGKPQTKADFLFQIETMKKDLYFANVTDWTKTTTGLKQHANYLASSIVKQVPAKDRAIFTNDTAVTSDGFAMLERLVTHLRGNTPEHRLMAVSDLASLEFKPDDTTATYMARLRGIQSILTNVTIDQLLTLFALSKMDTSLYPGVTGLFRQGDTNLLNDTLSQLETRMEREDRLRPLMGDSTDSARHARPPPKPNSQQDQEQVSTTYPPPARVKAHQLVEFTKDNTNCIACFARGKAGTFCRKGECHAALSAGFILEHAPDKAKEKLEEVRDKYKNPRGRSQGKGRRATDQDNDQKNPAPPAPKKPEDKQVVGSGKRATSTEKSPAPSYAEAARSADSDKPQRNYYDELESDSDDNEGYFVREEDDKPNSSSNAYLFQSARRATVSKTFSEIARRELRPMKIALKSEDEAVCCADSGATKHMFPDYNTFISYHKCHNKTVRLGDSTELPILGYGSAKFSLNGHVVIVRNALHVPGLTDPLYSLRQHRFMKGCGFFSHYDSGAFLLFPHFSVKVDDSVDCLLNFKPIGTNKSKPVEYAEPRTSDPAFNSARPAHVIPPEDSDDMSLVEYNIPVPKASSSLSRPSTPSPAPQKSPPSTPPSPTSVVTDLELETSASTPLSNKLLATIHPDPSNLPPVPPSYTAGACETRTKFDALKLHKIFGCRKFRTQSHLIASSKNASLLAGGELPPTLGDFASITMPNRGKPIKKRRKYLDKVHLDIVFGDCLGLGGYRYALILVDVATRYTWIYGMQTVSSADIIIALECFKADAGTYPKMFHADFDQKLIGGAALRHINKHSRIIAGPARQQSSNGLVESTWKTVVCMARAYITEKQVSREFWFFAIRHAVIMINQIPGRLGRRLTTPFELVYGVKPDSSTWFELFSVGYFDHKIENPASKSNVEVQTLAGIAVGRDEKANTIRFYNPLTRAYYSPPVFKLEEGRLPVSLFPTKIAFDSGLVCGLQSNNTDPRTEPFPPGTRVNVLVDGVTERGTIQHVPMPISPLLEPNAEIGPQGGENSEISTTYTVLLDTNKTVELTFADLLSPSTDTPPVNPAAPTTVWQGIPSRYLHQDAKITYEHDGTYHKGYLSYSEQTGFEFLVRRNSRSKKVDFRVPLPDFSQNGTTLLAEEKMLFGHTTVSSFLRRDSYNNAPSANHVSAKNLINPCPPSLNKALHPSNPDRHVWLESYKEEKGGLEQLEVFERISKKQYLHLKRTGRIGKALPSMCVLVIKPDKNGNPVRAKSRIVVLGNFEDRYYTKSQRYAPVLKYSSLRLLCSKAVGDKCILQQGDCKNAFCHARLPDDELTVVRPPVGDPEYDKDTYWLLNKTLYGLRRSPHHWYNMFTKALKDIGLSPSLHDPCLFSGVLNVPPGDSTNLDASNIGNGTSPSSSPDPTTSSPAPIHVGIYVDDFVFYSTDPQQEALFMEALKTKVVVDFMGPVDSRGW